jgi:hypothetical protein
MKRQKADRGVIAVAMVFVIMMSGILAAAIAMNRQRAPMAAMSLKRIQAQNYAEAAMYEVFNRFRLNSPACYQEWDPFRWVNVGQPTTVSDGAGNTLVTADGPAVVFPGAGVQALITVTEPVAGSGQYKVDVVLNYTNLQLQQ